MRSTFFGFEVARSALTTSQTGLDITGQNISNVNTNGYSRQRVEQSALSAISGNYQYAATAGAKVGQGVNVTGLARIRDTLLDSRYRKENSELSEQLATASALGDLENVFDETTVDGLHAQLNDLFQSLNELADSPESVEIATIFRSSAQKVTETLNSYAQQITEISNQIGVDLGINVDDVNNIALKLVDINTQIEYESLTGSPSNELLDMRDSLLDQLSSYSNITIEAQPGGASAVKIGSQYLINTNNTARTLEVDSSGSEIAVRWTDNSTAIDATKGVFKSNTDFINGKGSYATGTENTFKGLGYYREALDDLTSSFATEFNTLNANGGPAKPLFDGTTAATITISSDWLSNAQYITTADTGGEEGNNNNVMRMIDLMGKSIGITPSFSGTFEEFTVSLIGELGVQKSYYDDISSASTSVVAALEQQRESVMGVSLDEEAINMIKYEKSYNAAARLMTVLDEALDTLLTMGRVGR